MSNCFQIMLQNIRSLTKNLDDLQVLLESLSEKPSAICLTETWLKEFHHTKSMFLKGWKKNWMFRESMKSKTTEAKEKYQEQRKKVKRIVKVKMKQFYHKIIEKHAAKSNRKIFQLIRIFSGNEREKLHNLNQNEVNYFNHFFATIGENLKKKCRQSECSLKNQQFQSMFLLPTSKKRSSWSCPGV